MGKRTVYAVSSGSYSDYHVDFICENKEDAVAFCGGREADRGEPFWETFDFYDGPVPRRVVYTAYANTNHKPWVRDDIEIEISDEGEFFQPAVLKQGTTSFWFLEARGTDKERVVKSVADKYAELKARSEGLTD